MQGAEAHEEPAELLEELHEVVLRPVEAAAVVVFVVVVLLLLLGFLPGKGSLEANTFGLGGEQSACC